MSWGINALLIVVVLFILIRNRGEDDLKQFSSKNPEERKQIQAYARDTLKTTSDIKAIKILRKEFGLTLLEAKQAVDSIE